MKHELIPIVSMPVELRAWDTEKQQWMGIRIFRGGHTNEQSHYDGPDEFSIDRSFRHNSKNIIITQWSGLKDKRKRKIFTGDIVKYGTRNMVCLFFEGSFCFAGTQELTTLNKSVYRATNIIVESCLLVGNVFQNPEKFPAPWEKKKYRLSTINVKL